LRNMIMTWTEAVEKLRAMIEDEGSVFVKDNANTWTVNNLLDATRDGDDGGLHDLAVGPDGIHMLDANGYLVVPPVYWVVPRLE